ncbi:MAG: M16 family metallopeptidase [Prevotella sp.]
MKKRNLLTILCTALLATPTLAKDYKYQTVEGDLMKSRIYTLDNGLKVYLTVNEEKPRIQTYIAVRTGSRNDPAETTGLAHYFEHLMFKGTTHFGTSDYAAEKPLLDDIRTRFEVYRKEKDPALRKQLYHEIDSVSQLAAQYNIPNEYDKLMASIGAEGSNAYTSTDVTCYHEDIPSNELENWLKIQSDRFKHAVIRGFHTELETVYEEYNMSLANDMGKCFDALLTGLFPTHPYGTQKVIGTQDHLKNPSIVNIENYYNRYYVPNNIAVCMSGDFDPDKVISQIDQYFGDWQPNSQLSRPEFPALAPITSPKDTTVLGLEAERLMLAWRFGGEKELSTDTLNVISQMMYNGNAGVLEIDLEQPMKVQMIQAGVQPLTDYTVFIVGASPIQGQKLEDARALILEEIEKMKRGEFSDDLLQSVKNNIKQQYYKQLLSNRSRASMFVNSFVSGRPWETTVAEMDRINGMTKQQIMDFINRHFGQNFVCVYKRKGEDTTLVKIDKPTITPIPANRDKASQFLNDIANSEAEPIQPVFVDFSKDMKLTKTKQGLPILYKQNTNDGLFDLVFRYEFGSEDVKGLALVPSYLYYIGTDKKTAVQIKQEFYKLACDYYISVNGDVLEIGLSGLNENMPAALALLEDFLQNAKADRESYDSYVSLLEKERNDAKGNQKSCFNALQRYGMWGKYNSLTNTLGIDELKAGDPQRLPDMLKGLNSLQHRVLYFGPSTEKELTTALAKLHKTPKKFAPVPDGKPYTRQQFTKNETMIAPYDAKNIYMIEVMNTGKKWNPTEEAVIRLFNEYFGGGMNAIVFQELREARGLAYSAAARYNRPDKTDESEMFYDYIITQNDKMMDCIGTFREIIDTIPQSQGAFDIAKQNLLKSLQTQRTTRGNVLDAYINMERLGLQEDISKIVYDKVSKLTLQDIVDFEKKNVVGKPRLRLILGNKDELDIKALEKLGPVRYLTTEEIFGY